MNTAVTIWKCDKCGREVALRSGQPQGWTRVSREPIDGDSGAGKASDICGPCTNQLERFLEYAPDVADRQAQAV